MMVEDEFYAIASDFTQHLHYAEYVRRTKEAKQQNAAAIRDLERPTDGTALSDETRKRKEAEELAARQRAALAGKDDEGDDAEDDEEFAGTLIYDLMTSPRKARSLVGERGVKSSTRAAAGYAQRWSGGGIYAGGPVFSPPAESQQEVETTSEDDDLDAHAPSPTTTLPRRTDTPARPAENTHARRSAKVKTQTKDVPSSIRQTDAPARPTASNHTNRPQVKPETKDMPSMNARYRTPTAFQPKKRMLFDDLDELPAFNKSKRPVPERSNSQRKNPPGDESKSKKSRLNEVPTFLL